MMNNATCTFRVFVSSTFGDLKSERYTLQRQVFPRLRTMCALHGTRFQSIDLRWGMSEQAALDQRTMSICLSEIARCQLISPRPNFVILMGDHAEVVIILIEAGADTNRKNQWRNTALRASGNSEIRKMLMGAGAEE